MINFHNESLHKVLHSVFKFIRVIQTARRARAFLENVARDLNVCERLVNF